MNASKEEKEVRQKQHTQANAQKITIPLRQENKGNFQATPLTPVQESNTMKSNKPVNNSQITPQNQSDTNKVNKIPPVILRDNERYIEIAKACMLQTISTRHVYCNSTQNIKTNLSNHRSTRFDNYGWSPKKQWQNRAMLDASASGTHKTNVPHHRSASNAPVIALPKNAKNQNKNQRRAQIVKQATQLRIAAVPHGQN